MQENNYLKTYERGCVSKGHWKDFRAAAHDLLLNMGVLLIQYTEYVYKTYMHNVLCFIWFSKSMLNFTLKKGKETEKYCFFYTVYNF